jgi:hypothetical protein
MATQSVSRLLAKLTGLISLGAFNLLMTLSSGKNISSYKRIKLTLWISEKYKAVGVKEFHLNEYTPNGNGNAWCIPPLVPILLSSSLHIT